MASLPRAILLSNNPLGNDVK